MILLKSAKKEFYNNLTKTILCLNAQNVVGQK